MEEPGGLERKGQESGGAPGASGPAPIFLRRAQSPSYQRRGNRLPHHPPTPSRLPCRPPSSHLSNGHSSVSLGSVKPYFEAHKGGHMLNLRKGAAVQDARSHDDTSCKYIGCS